MKFLLDEQLSPVVAKWMVAKGVEADHVARLGLLRTLDVEIARYALRNGYVVVTKDIDYLDLPRPGLDFQVLWLAVGNVPNRVLIARLEAAWPEVMDKLSAGEGVVTVYPADPPS